MSRSRRPLPRLPSLQLRCIWSADRGSCHAGSNLDTHVSVDRQLKTKAADTLASVGLALCDAVRILLTRVAAEGGLPPGLTTDAEADDARFYAKVREA